MEKPTFKQRLDGLTTFLWDSNTGKVLGRGARSWAEISLFYIVYYACLAAFFAATLAVFYETVPTDSPKLLSDSSLLDGNPGMGFRPRVDVTHNKITVKDGGLGKNEDVVNGLNEFLEPYKNVKVATEPCDAMVKMRPDGDAPCSVDYQALIGQCPLDQDYGYANQKPCVFIKLNKVYGWKPDLWEAGDSKIPDQVAKGYDPTIVPINCGTKDKKDNIKLGDVTYFPHQGFRIPYFPYLNQKGYRSPLVVLQFPNITKNTGFDIECRVFAKNIEYDRTEVQGSVQFKLNFE